MKSSPDGYARSAEEFDTIRAEAEKLVKWGAITPDWVFTAQDGQVDFFDYTAVESSYLDPILGVLVSIFGDDTVSAIEADLGDYLPIAKAPWYWPAFKIPAANAHKIYGEMLHFWGGSGVGSMALNSDLLYVFGSSGQWAICGDRSWEMGILWTKSTPPIWREPPKPPFCDAKEAIEYFATMAHLPGKPPPDDVELFLKNYEPFEIGPLDHSRETAANDFLADQIDLSQSKWKELTNEETTEQRG